MKDDCPVRLSAVGDEIRTPLKARVSASVEMAQQGLRSSSCFCNKQPGVTHAWKKN